jgi:hypothetical protein
MNRAWTAALQVLGTLLILGWLPTNFGKLAALLLLWALTFRNLSGREWAMIAILCLFFSINDMIVVSQGHFRFNHPDWKGLPVWEFFMWGFYFLHTYRFLRGPVPAAPRTSTWILLLLFGASFSVIANPNWLFLVAGALLAVTLWLQADRQSWRYAGYMACLGTAVELLGVHTGLWAYPGHPWAGVPLWFLPMWAGVGVFSRSVFLPWVEAKQK